MALGYGAFPMRIAVTSSERDFMNHGKVTNLCDAVRKITGTEQMLSKNIRLGCYTPTAKSMEEILGGLVLVCTFLSGRVKAEGVFAGAASTPLTEKPQLVQFNLPVPLGIACSLTSVESIVVAAPSLSSSLRDIMILMPDSELKIDSSYNYRLPLILGGDRDNGNLREALTQSVEDEEQLSAPLDKTCGITTLPSSTASLDAASARICVHGEPRRISSNIP